MTPPVGASAPPIRPIRVDLPAPFGPMMPSTSPGRTAKLRSSTAGSPPKRLVTPSRARMGVVVVSDAPLGGPDGLDAVGRDEALDTSHPFREPPCVAELDAGRADGQLAYQPDQPLWQEDRHQDDQRAEQLAVDVAEGDGGGLHEILDEDAADQRANDSAGAAEERHQHHRDGVADIEDAALAGRLK